MRANSYGEGPAGTDTSEPTDFYESLFCNYYYYYYAAALVPGGFCFKAESFPPAGAFIDFADSFLFIPGLDCPTETLSI